MPRGFTQEQEKTIRQRLVDSAFAHLSSTGIRKTSVEVLASDANISNGAFYHFFPSKEAAFFYVYDSVEQELKDRFLSLLSEKPPQSKEDIAALLTQIMLSDSMDSLLKLIQKDEMDYMLRSIDQKTISEHEEKDRQFMTDVLAHLESTGWKVVLQPGQLLSLLQVLFLVSYEKGCYRDDYQLIMSILIDSIVNKAIQ